jgi:hypothetical protein
VQLIAAFRLFLLARYVHEHQMVHPVGQGAFLQLPSVARAQPVDQILDVTRRRSATRSLELIFRNQEA